MRKYYILIMKKNTSKRSLTDEDEELQQIDDNRLITNINGIILKAEELQTKLINIKEPIEGEFSDALEQFDLGQELQNRSINNATQSRELLSDPQWVKNEREKLIAANEMIEQISIMDGDPERNESKYQAAIINDSNLTNAMEIVEDYDQIQRENQTNSIDLNEREVAMNVIDEYIDRLQNIKVSLNSTLNNTPSPMGYVVPLSQIQINRVKSANHLANKDNADQGTHFAPISFSEIRKFENDYERNVLTPIQRSQSAPPSNKVQKKGGKTIKRNKNKYKKTRRIKYNAKRGTRRNYKKSKKSSKSKRTIRRRSK